MNKRRFPKESRKCEVNFTLIDIVIKNLEFYIENFHNPSALIDADYILKAGLCCNTGLTGIKSEVIELIFRNWVYFKPYGKGGWSSTIYPLGTCDYENNSPVENMLKPLRLHLALHCLLSLKAIVIPDNYEVFIEDFDSESFYLYDSLGNSYVFYTEVITDYIDESFDHEFGTEHVYPKKTNVRILNQIPTLNDIVKELQPIFNQRYQQWRY